VRLVVTQQGAVVDETAAITIDLPVHVPPASPSESDPAPVLDPLRKPAGSFRVMVWNVAGMRRVAEGRYVRMFRAVDPDVVMLDEVSPRRTEAELARWLSESTAAGPESWQVVLGQSDAQRSAIGLRRGPLDRVLGFVPFGPNFLASLTAGLEPATSQWMFRQNLEESGVPVTSAVGTIGGRTVAFTVVDLASGGAAGTAADTQRIMEAVSIRAAVADALSTRRPDAVLVGGDFNLVGSRRPLDALARALDRDGSALSPVEALRLDGRSNATWRPLFGARFTPGRLDWLLYSDSTLDPVRSFVLNVWDLSPYWQKRHELTSEDSDQTSDHMPIVADFVWRR
jgi:endonuclease/exonuclease/phosphatase family metal-dependent hydrolase